MQSLNPIRLLRQPQLLPRVYYKLPTSLYSKIGPHIKLYSNLASRYNSLGSDNCNITLNVSFLQRSYSSNKLNKIDSENSFINQNNKNVSEKNPANLSESIYSGPLTKVSKLLRMTSILSVMGVTVASPWFFLLESSLPTVARLGLLTVTATMMTGSLFLVNWAFKPYVNSVKILSASASSKVTKDTLIMIEKFDLWARRQNFVVRLGSLSPVENIPMKTWFGSSDTVLSSAEIEEIQNILKHNSSNKSYILGKQDEYYYVHLDMPISPSMQKITEVI